MHVPKFLFDWLCDQSWINRFVSDIILILGSETYVRRYIRTGRCMTSAFDIHRQRFENHGAFRLYCARMYLPKQFLSVDELLVQWVRTRLFNLPGNEFAYFIIFHTVENVEQKRFLNILLKQLFAPRVNDSHKRIEITCGCFFGKDFNCQWSTSRVERSSTHSGRLYIAARQILHS